MTRRQPAWLQAGGGLFLIILSALLAGCAGLNAGQGLQQPENAPEHIVLKAVPFYPQEQYQCGPAALAMALSWSGLPTTPEALVAEVYTPTRQGSLQTAMIGGARRHGRVAYPLYDLDTLITEVAAGHPVIVLQNLGLSWYPFWHYAVVIGYDMAARDFILHSGVTPHKRLPFKVFVNTWARGDNWGLLVLDPAELPATAREQTYLEALLGLEQTRQWQSALAGYETALLRWSNSLGALMGLGNSHYALGDLTQAEIAFRKASRQHPNTGATFNNLAHVLSEQGRWQEALEAARQAVDLGGPRTALYRKTLEEIEAGI